MYIPWVVYFGLRNAPPFFQRMMACKFEPLTRKYESYLSNYLNDWIIATPGEEEGLKLHWQITHKFLDLLQQLCYCDCRGATFTLVLFPPLQVCYTLFSTLNIVLFPPLQSPWVLVTQGPLLSHILTNCPTSWSLANANLKRPASNFWDGWLPRKASPLI